MQRYRKVKIEGIKGYCYLNAAGAAFKYNSKAATREKAFKEVTGKVIKMIDMYYYETEYSNGTGSMCICGYR